MAEYKPVRLTVNDPNGVDFQNFQSTDTIPVANIPSLTLSKLSQSGATNDQVPKWNGSAWTPANQLPYKSYVALLTQTGEDAPVATVVYNTLSGTPTWDYQTEGAYRINLTGEFTSGKTMAFVSGANLSGLGYTFTIQYLSADTIRILSNSDSWMTNTAFEIRVYP